VQVAPEKTNATARATVMVKLGNDNNPITQPVEIQFTKEGRDWLILSANPQKSLKPE
jgi:hypothetical protein